MNVGRVESWIKKRLLDTPELRRFVLRHGQETGVGRVVARYPIPETGDADSNARAIAAAVSEAVREHCEAYDRTQRFSLVAVDEREQDICARDFVERGVMLSKDEGHSEPATPKGIADMVMRHLEAREHLLFETIGRTISDLRSENASLRASQTRADELRIKLIREHEELLDGREARRLEAKSADKDEERKAEAWQELQKLLPMFGKNLNSVGGVKKKPGANGANGSNGHANGKSNGEAATKPPSSPPAPTPDPPKSSQEAAPEEVRAEVVTPGADVADFKRKFARVFSKIPPQYVDALESQLTDDERADFHSLMPEDD